MLKLTFNDKAGVFIFHEDHGNHLQCYHANSILNLYFQTFTLPGYLHFYKY